eukprot:1801889-Prymnesium_polylepis.1
MGSADEPPGGGGCCCGGGGGCGGSGGASRPSSSPSRMCRSRSRASAAVLRMVSLSGSPSASSRAERASVESVRIGVLEHAAARDQRLGRLSQVLHLHVQKLPLRVGHERAHLLVRVGAQLRVKLLRLAVAFEPVVVMHKVVEVCLGGGDARIGRRVARLAVMRVVRREAKVAELRTAPAVDPVAAAVLLNLRVALAAALCVRLHPRAGGRVVLALVLPAGQLFARERKVHLARAFEAEDHATRALDFQLPQLAHLDRVRAVDSGAPLHVGVIVDKLLLREAGEAGEGRAVHERLHDRGVHERRASLAHAPDALRVAITDLAGNMATPALVAESVVATQHGALVRGHIVHAHETRAEVTTAVVRALPLGAGRERNARVLEHRLRRVEVSLG